MAILQLLFCTEVNKECSEGQMYDLMDTNRLNQALSAGFVPVFWDTLTSPNGAFKRTRLVLYRKKE